MKYVLFAGNYEAYARPEKPEGATVSLPISSALVWPVCPLRSIWSATVS